MVQNTKQLSKNIQLPAKIRTIMKKLTDHVMSINKLFMKFMLGNGKNKTTLKKSLVNHFTKANALFDSLAKQTKYKSHPEIKLMMPYKKKIQSIHKQIKANV